MHSMCHNTSKTINNECFFVNDNYGVELFIQLLNVMQ